MKRFDLIELITVVICLLFAIVISLYHISYEGYLGLSEQAWSIVWAIAENGLSLVLCFLLGLYTTGIVRLLFNWLFIPYFSLKLVYHLSCYSGIRLFSTDTWETIWSFVLVVLIIGALILIKRKNVA